MLTLKYVRVLIRRPRKLTLHPLRELTDAQRKTTHQQEVVALSKPRLLGEGARLHARDENAALVAADERDVLQQVVANHRQFLHRLQGGVDPREGRQRRTEGPACQRIWPKHVVNHLKRFTPEGKSACQSVRMKTRLSRESFLKMLLTCSRSYVSIPSDWWDEDEEWTEGGPRRTSSSVGETRTERLHTE